MNAKELLATRGYKYAVTVVGTECVDYGEYYGRYKFAKTVYFKTDDEANKYVAGLNNDIDVDSYVIEQL